MDISFVVQVTSRAVLLVFHFTFNHHVGQKKTASDSTKSRDCKADQQILPVTSAPDIDTLLTVRPQITFLQQNHFDEIFSVVTYVANATYIIPAFPNLPVTVSTLQISETPILHQDKQLGVSHRRRMLS